MLSVRDNTLEAAQNGESPETDNPVGKICTVGDRYRACLL